MRVLWINTVCGTGSTGRIALDAYRKMRQEGHECLFAYGRGSAPKDVNAVRIGTDIDKYAHALLTRLTDKTAFYSKRATRKFLQIVKEFAPDRIEMHNLHGYYIDIRQLFYYIKEKRISVVWTLHDCWAFTGHCAYFDFAECEKWKTGCIRCPQKHEYPKSSFWDQSKWNFEQKKKIFTGVEDMTIITPSKWLAGLVKQSFLKEYPVKVKYNQIDTTIFQPTESDFRKEYNIEEKFVVLGVANIWERRKGLQDFIKLAEMLDEAYKIVLVGIDKQAKKMIPSNIIALDRTENTRQLAQLYTMADVYLNLTYEDNYPTTNLEAHACGTTVVSYRTGGSVESADEVIEKGDLEAVRQLLRMLKAN